MDKVVRDVLEWVLVESESVPKEIRRKALSGLTGPTASGEGTVYIGDVEVSQETYDICEEHCRNQKKIQAIKDFRQMTGLGLKESKEAIEAEFNHSAAQTRLLENRGF